LQAVPERIEAVFVQPAFKDTFLDADTLVEAGLCDAPEASGTSNVVNNNAEHFLYPRRRKMRTAGQQVFPPILDEGAHAVQVMYRSPSAEVRE
jgi:hypothetical protein